MEDLFEKFYGKPDSEGSSDAPRPDESTTQPQREQRVSDDDPYAHESWDDLPDERHGPRELQSPETGIRACTICGRQFPADQGKMRRHNQFCPKTLHCPKCYDKLMVQRKDKRFVLGVILAIFVIIALVFLTAIVMKGFRRRASRKRHQALEQPQPSPAPEPAPPTLKDRFSTRQ